MTNGQSIEKSRQISYFEAMQAELKEQVEKLPQKPGVYLFRNIEEQILYIGKAKNLKKRVSDHFLKKSFPDQNFIDQVSGVETIGTKTEKEALILENRLIKQYRPKYNTQWKDDKNYAYVAIGEENFPLIFVTHQTHNKEFEYIGPFVSAKELKKLLAELRKILPFRTCKHFPKKTCLYYDMGLCLGYCINAQYKNQYQRILQMLCAILKLYEGKGGRSECYDISNLGGTLCVGSMVAFKNNKPDKSQYRKFKIKSVSGQDDVSSLREILQRRLNHKSWPTPELFLLDGGKGQLKAARDLHIPVLAITKIERNPHKAKIFSPFSKKALNLQTLPPELARFFLQIRDEAHRFAIGYNKKRRMMKLKGQI
ncbi:MAG: GIY-YIG nuclease family protein [Candidatus Paceibacterota bacterium]